MSTHIVYYWSIPRADGLQVASEQVSRVEQDASFVTFLVGAYDIDLIHLLDACVYQRDWFRTLAVW